MRDRNPIKVLWFAVAALPWVTGMGAFELSDATTQAITKGDCKAPIIQEVAKLRMPFVENQGQVRDTSVRFYARTLGGTVSVTQKGEMVYVFPAPLKPMSEASGRRSAGWVFQETLVGAETANLKGVDPSPAKVHAYIGNDPSQWKTDLSTFHGLSLGEVYKRVDLSLKAYGKTVEKIFTIQPGADPGAIRVKVAGALALRIDDQGRLEIETGQGVVRFSRPVAFQDKRGQRETVQVAYGLRHDT